MIRALTLSVALALSMEVTSYAVTSMPVPSAASEDVTSIRSVAFVFGSVCDNGVQRR